MTDLARAVMTGLLEAALTDLVLKPKIWTGRPRTDSAVDNRANASKIFNAAAVIGSVVADLAAVALVAGVASGVDDEN